MDSLKNIFISRPFDNTNDLIRNIGENMNHHLVFKNNTLIKIINIHPYSNDILQMKEGDTYDFINGFPKPFYDFYNKYYNDETNIYAIYLSEEELGNVLHINHLVDTIYNNTNSLNKDPIYNHFISNYNNLNNSIEKNIYKNNFINKLLHNTYEQHKISSYCI